MKPRRLSAIIGIACISVGAAGRSATALPLPPPPESTTTTIIPIWVPLDVSPASGPPGSVVSVHGANCVYGATAVDVTLSTLDQPDVPLDSAHVVPDANGVWSTSLTLPGDTVVGGPPYTVNARCSQPTTTIFYYQPGSVSVSAEESTTSASSTSTTASSSTTTTLVATTTATEAIAGVVDTQPADPATASRSAMLPRTGAGNAPGLTLLAVSLVAAGSLLVLSRRRSRRVYR